MQRSMRLSQPAEIGNEYLEVPSRPPVVKHVVTDAAFSGAFTTLSFQDTPDVNTKRSPYTDAVLKLIAMAKRSVSLGLRHQYS